MPGVMRYATMLGALAALLVVAGTPLQAQGPALPQGEGRDIVATACSQCHALTPIVGMRDGEAGWRRHVRNMVLRGAQVRPSEFETVVSYLTANFGPASFPVGKVTLPNGPGKELVENRCTTCHDLERVAGVKRSKRDWPKVVANMVERGALATPEETQSIAGYLVANFGSD
jgi:cytochrome c5